MSTFEYYYDYYGEYICSVLAILVIVALCAFIVRLILRFFPDHDGYVDLVVMIGTVAVIYAMCYIFGWWMLIIGPVILVLVIAFLDEWGGNRKQRRVDERRKQEKKKYKEQYARLRTQYGKALKVVRIKPWGDDDCYDYKKDIAVFNDSRKLLIYGNEYDFDDIISYTYNDDFHVDPGKVVLRSNTSQLSVLGHAFIGKSLAGWPGALVGAMAAEEASLSVYKESARIIHNYTVFVTVNDAQNPIVNIICGLDTTAFFKIIDLLDRIILYDIDQY